MEVQFKYISDSWGVFAAASIIDVNLSAFEKQNTTLYKISDKMYLSIPKGALPEPAIDCIFTAFLDHEREISGLLTFQTVFIIDSFDLSYSDYQHEGMYCLVIQYINDRFHQNISMPTIVFDKKQNRYTFSSIHVQHATREG